MMKNIIWKKFTLGELFVSITGRDSKIAQKNLDKSISQDDEYNLSIVTESAFNNAVGFYMKKDDPIVKGKIVDSGLTYGTQFGNANYHSYPHFIIGNVNYLKIISKQLNDICDVYVGTFFSILINKIFKKSGLFGFVNKIDQENFKREIILLPCIEVKEDDGYIWEDDGRYYTLAVEYINKLMEEAKELREKKTIRLYEAERAKYEAERAKYEAERAKYEAGYKKEKNILVWKKFTLGELFDRNSSHAIKAQKKELDESKEFDEFHTIRNITASKNNCGCSGFLADKDEVRLKKRNNLLTIASDAAYGGVCFYQTEEFVSTGHNNILEIKNNNLKKCLDDEINIYYFFSKMITKLLHNDMINRFLRPIGADFDREIILLPCIEVKEDDGYIWEDDGRYYTLAVEYISYLYLSGRVQYNQNLIDKYTYRY